MVGFLLAHCRVLIILIMLISVFSCGDGAVDYAMDFEPNKAPVIQNIRTEPENGIFTIYVDAYDPEGMPLEYSFISSTGSFANKEYTNNGVMIDFFLPSVMTNGVTVSITVSVIDNMGKNVIQTTNLETAEYKVVITLADNPSIYENTLYKKSSDDLVLNFKADSKGSYGLLLVSSEETFVENLGNSFWELYPEYVQYPYENVNETYEARLGIEEKNYTCGPNSGGGCKAYLLFVDEYYHLIIYQIPVLYDDDEPDEITFTFAEGTDSCNDSINFNLGAADNSGIPIRGWHIQEKESQTASTGWLETKPLSYTFQEPCDPTEECTERTLTLSVVDYAGNERSTDITLYTGYGDVDGDGIEDCKDSDIDGDGYINFQDCDALDRFVYLDALEIGCDLKDNNCNGEVDEDEVIIFEDDVLANAVSSEAGIPEGDPVLNTDVCSIGVLSITNNDLTNIKGVEYLYNLWLLMLTEGQINDISSITYLENLTALRLDMNQINDISILADLKKLGIIYLESNQISDISPLSALPNLTLLFLSGNQISDISPIEGIETINTLSLSANPINDYSPLSGLVNLYELVLASNGIDDIGFLSGLEDLQNLTLDNNQISNLGPLSGLTNLRELSLAGNSINDIGPLSGLYRLRNLSLDDNPVSDYSPLSGLDTISQLYLDGNGIDDIGFVSGLINLQRLSLDNNQVSVLTPLSGLSDLRYVYLTNNLITDINAFSGLLLLRELVLTSNQISDISPLVINSGASGLGTDDSVNIQDNNLDSGDCGNISILESNGVLIEHDLTCE